jgi:hypothetical protein
MGSLFTTRRTATACGAVALGAAIVLLSRTGRRSGVSRADLARPLPGDELVAGAGVSLPRSF